jgi:hypothetical protein
MLYKYEIIVLIIKIDKDLFQLKIVNIQYLLFITNSFHFFKMLLSILIRR